MRTADQTLLARMGFSDPDKGDRRHDLACRYLVTDEVRAKLYSLFARKQGHRHEDELRAAMLGAAEGPLPDHVLATSGGTEAPILKGSGQYRQYVGFVDAVVVGATRSVWQDWEPSSPYHPRAAGFVGRGAQTPFWIGCEAKVGPVASDSVVRQIGVYDGFADAIQFPVDDDPAWGRLFLPPSAKLGWVLATCYDLSKADVAELRAHGIVHVRLGRLFDAYVEQVSASEVADSPEV